MARAVRIALAATTLALAGTSAAYAGTCATSADTTQCTGSFNGTLSFPDAVDLTLVVGDGLTPTSVTPASGDAGVDITGDGALHVVNNASITTYGADGIHAYSTGSVDVANNGYVATYVDGAGQEAIDASANGNVTVTNTGNVFAYSDSAYDVTAVRAETVGCGCTVTVENSGNGVITAMSSNADAIGVYAYAGAGNVEIDNAFSIQAMSYDGLADGVFAAGEQVDVHNAGGIAAQGGSWAAGIEAEGSDLTTVQNDGDILAYATGYMGQAFGIYATGGAGGVTIGNSDTATVLVNGYYATGIDANASGNVSVSNAGDITVADSLIGTGIHAGSNGDGAAVNVANDGSISAHSYYGSTGIEIVATGAGSSGSATNAGTVSVDQSSKYGSSAGIVVSADGDSHVDNSGSVYVTQGGFGPPVFAPEGITPYYGGSAYGVLALSFNGDASAVNSGDIHVASMPSGYAAGVVAASQNGNASSDNSGLVQTLGKYAYGVVASSGGGDASVHNDADGAVYAASFVGLPYSLAAGLVGLSSAGDVTIDNAGLDYAIAYGVAAGTLGVSTQGNVTETNSGDIVAYAYAGLAIGMFGRADAGTANVENGGSLYAGSYYGDAVGILTRGATAQGTNTADGAIHAYGYTSAYGIEAIGTDLADITNDGAIVAIANNGVAIGAMGISIGDVSIDGSGSVDVEGSQAAIGLYGYAPGTVTIANAGSVKAYSATGAAYGIFGAGGNVDLHNDGDIDAEGYAFVAGVEGRGDTVSVANTGAITATGHHDVAFGLYADGTTSAHADNSGSVTVTAPHLAVGMGVFGDGEGAVASATNSGDLYASSSSKYGVATGILAGGDGGTIVTHTGDIEVAAATAFGIRAGSQYGNVTVDHDGAITANGAKYAYGIIATSETGDVTIHGGADADVHTIGTLRSYGIVGYASSGDVTIDNAGGVYATSIQDAFAIYAGSGEGDVSVSNTGDLTAVSGFGGAFGVYANAGHGTASVTNGGTIHAYSTSRGAIGIAAFGAAAAVDNAGSIAVHAYTEYAGPPAEDGPGFGPAMGILAYGSAVDVGNSGDVAAYAYGAALGIVADGDSVHVGNAGAIVAQSVYSDARGITAYGADVVVDSSGSINVTTAHGAYVQGIYAGGGAVSVANTGTLTASSAEAGFVQGIAAYGNAVSVDNGGHIAAQGTGVVAGIVAVGDDDVTVNNTGSVAATVAGNSDSVALGASVFGYGAATLTNSGDIAAVSNGDGDAIGVLVQGNGLVTVDNTGTISATQADYAVAVALNSATGAVLTNHGTLRTYASREGRIAVRGGDNVDHVLNYGQIDGALLLNGGDDLVFNGTQGIWNVGNHATDFGDGDDMLVNGTGGLVNLTQASIAFGAGDDGVVNATGGVTTLHDGTISLGGSGDAGNTFVNNGTIRVLGTGNLIDMGSAPVTGLVPSLNPLPLVNNALIDFVDGAPDDVLTIAGDLDGNGHLQVDLRPLTHASDMLYVDGSVADGAVQTVDVDFGSVPTLAMLDGTPVAFARVAGTSSADAFVGGRVLGYDPGNFLNLQVQVSSNIDASAADVFSVGVDVTGLSNSGAVAASLAPGAQSMVDSLVGTWRQRAGVLVDKGVTGLSPWLRMFTDRGNISADQSSNFGQSGPLGFDQDNSGWELGLDARPWEQIHVGVLLGEADGNQRLAGVGSGDVGGQTFGLYGTWVGDTGFYVDASFRWTGLTARVRADGMQQYTDGEADSFNVEAGFGAWSLPGDVLIQPQAQYTHTSLDLAPLVADQTTFDAKSATSSRGRVGVLFSKTIAGDGWTWMPYGSVSAVREFDGKYTYAINDEFVGSTRTEGTSALVELGLGVHKDKVTVSGGLNWTDGGALDSFVGGQLVLRTTW